MHGSYTSNNSNNNQMVLIQNNQMIMKIDKVFLLKQKNQMVLKIYKFFSKKKIPAHQLGVNRAKYTSSWKITQLTETWVWTYQAGYVDECLSEVPDFHETYVYDEENEEKEEHEEKEEENHHHQCYHRLQDTFFYPTLQAPSYTSRNNRVRYRHDYQ